MASREDRMPVAAPVVVLDRAEEGRVQAEEVGESAGLVLVTRAGTTDVQLLERDHFRVQRRQHASYALDIDAPVTAPAVTHVPGHDAEIRVVHGRSTPAGL